MRLLWVAFALLFAFLAIAEAKYRRGSVTKGDRIRWLALDSDDSEEKRPVYRRHRLRMPKNFKAEVPVELDESEEIEQMVRFKR